MIPDIIITWPKNCDYPLWRQFIRDNRTRFNEIIIGFHNPYTSPDYSEFVKEVMHPDYVHTFNVLDPRPGEDWRDLSVNAGLLHSYNADWIWFTEQDFYPGGGFWDEIQRHESDGCGVIAVYQQDRMHPCCIFVKRTVLNKTRKMFGIVPNKADHFYLFQKDIEDARVKVGTIDPKTYYHYNGLSQNWRLASDGGVPNYEIDKFVDHLRQCLLTNVPRHPKFEEIAHAVITRHGGQK